MKRWLVRVTESINHDYVVQAEDRDGAYEAYCRLTAEQLRKGDLDGSSDWDAPWCVEELEDGAY